MAVNHRGLTASEVLMIGDDVRDDAIGAVKAGMTGVLVKTGKYSPTDEGVTEDGVAPSFVLDSVVDLLDLLPGPPSIDAQ